MEKVSYRRFLNLKANYLILFTSWSSILTWKMYDWRILCSTKKCENCTTFCFGDTGKHRDFGIIWKIWMHIDFCNWRRPNWQYPFTKQNIPNFKATQLPKPNPNSSDRLQGSNFAIKFLLHWINVHFLLNESIFIFITIWQILDNLHPHKQLTRPPTQKLSTNKEITSSLHKGR